MGINHLTTKLYLSDLKTQFVPRSKHSLPRFQNRYFNVAWRNNRCLFWDPSKTIKFIVGRTQNFWILKLMSHKVSLGFKKFIPATSPWNDEQPQHPRAIPLLSGKHIINSLFNSARTQQIHSLPIYKSGNMIRLIEPSSGQFTTHIRGTSSRCANVGSLRSHTNEALSCSRLYKNLVVLWKSIQKVISFSRQAKKKSTISHKSKIHNFVSV
jgi:hypothetical protein